MALLVFFSFLRLLLFALAFTFARLGNQFFGIFEACASMALFLVAELLDFAAGIAFFAFVLYGVVLVEYCYFGINSLAVEFGILDCAYSSVCIALLYIKQGILA